MAYEIVEGISMADMAFRVRGSTLDELFYAGASALASIMLQNPESIRKTEFISFLCEAPDPELLYFDVLSEFIFYKDSRRLLLLPERMEIKRSGQGYSCSCRAGGEIIDRSRHLFNVDIKAVTMHSLSVIEEPAGWVATAVVDV